MIPTTATIPTAVLANIRLDTDPPLQWVATHIMINGWARRTVSQ
jgi:hypothetical protein